MLYKKLSDLPQNIRNLLPEFAQEVYLEAFNSTLRYYQRLQTSDMSPEEIADQAAWAAVRQEYQRVEDSGR